MSCSKEFIELVKMFRTKRDTVKSLHVDLTEVGYKDKELIKASMKATHDVSKAINDIFIYIHNKI